MTNYEKSNNIQAVEYSRLSSKEFETLLKDLDRVKAGQDLLNYLCKKYKIACIPLKVLNQPRKCKGNGQTYGFYKCIGGKGMSITIYNLTAKTGKKVAIKTFVHTLLHEFIHHYDTEFLKIQSTHTSGFYKRISDLQTKLER